MQAPLPLLHPPQIPQLCCVDTYDSQGEDAVDNGEDHDEEDHNSDDYDHVDNDDEVDAKESADDDDRAAKLLLCTYFRPAVPKN